MVKYIEWLTKEGLIKVGGWARDGLADKQIAQNIGIFERTFTDWKKKSSSISSVLKEGKEIVDRQVKNALSRNATSYEYIEVTEELAGKGVEITKKIAEQVTPNPVVTVFWLKNRKPDEWRDRKETQVSGEMSASNPFANLPGEELRRLTGDDG